ncbi:MAG TPA: hypothetical protein VM686_20775 [Polyangiaceae bacterium]|nr:hypothetical protein [Polyangiaceae bacterium]
MSVCESTRNLAIESLHQGAELSGGHLGHLESCDDCRSFMERTRRMSALVFADEPTAAEVLRLRVRLGSGIAGMGSTRPPYRRRPAWQFAFAGGFVLLSTTAVVAATGNGGRFLEAVGLQPAAETTAAPVPKAPKHVVKRHAPAEVPPAPVEEPVAAPSTEPVERIAPVARVRATESKRKAEAKWADVAKSLRSKNYDRAQRSLNELSQSGDAVERDTARLSLAQLWLQQGKTAQARQLLRELSASGSSPFIRKRAGELLP